jgi:hypothetical protein
MRPRHYALLIALALLAGYAGRALSDRLPAPRVASASAAQDGQDEWEYCAVTKARYPGAYWIVYFRPNGVQVVDVRAAPTESAQGKAISQLGAEGWVMVGQGTLDVQPPPPQGMPAALYFRRMRR